MFSKVTPFHDSYLSATLCSCHIKVLYLHNMKVYMFQQVFCREIRDRIEGLTARIEKIEKALEKVKVV